MVREVAVEPVSPLPPSPYWWLEVPGVSSVVARPRKPNIAAPAANPAGRGDELGRLKRLGFSTLAECLLSVPRAFLDFTTSVGQVTHEMLDASFYCVLRAEETTAFDSIGRKTKFWPSAFRVQIQCVDAAGTPVRITAFGNVWPWKPVGPGDNVHVYGRLGSWNGEFTLSSPQLVEPHMRGKIACVYRGKSGQVSGEKLGEGISHALHRIDEACVLLLAQAGLREAEFPGVCGYESAESLLHSLHRPKTLAEGLRARTAARKLTVETVVRRAAGAKARPSVAASAIPIDRNLIKEISSELPFPLTKDQIVAVDEIVADLRSAYPMRRLLSGDVGTGKSIAFMLPAAAAYEAGAEVAILAPSQLVAEQLARELRELFPGLPVCLVLAGDTIGQGICVGTTALLRAAKKAKKAFGLVIVDEQHKFSVDQKFALVGKHTNLLEATATAIPRTLALVNFGGMDVSLLTQCPVTKSIETIVIDDQAMPDVHEFIVRDILRPGGQIAVIYPLVEEAAAKQTGVDGANPQKSGGASTAGLESVISAGRLWSQKFPGKVGVLHGRMSPEEKTAVIADMNAHRISILISSSVIEVGVTLPSLRAIIIESPERYGISQLHQLRGRVARKGGEGTMFLHAGPKIQGDAMLRLRVLEECSDGFTLAERDMDLRGFGDVEEDAEAQTGSTRTLFYGVELSHQEIRDTAKRFGLRV